MACLALPIFTEALAFNVVIAVVTVLAGAALTASRLNANPAANIVTDIRTLDVPASRITGTFCEPVRTGCDKSGIDVGVQLAVLG